MPLVDIAPPLTGGLGFGPQQRIPVTGGSPPPASSDPTAINQWLRQQPWYRDALTQWGTNPDDPHLSVQRRAQLLDATNRAGAHLGDDYNINGNGQFENIKTPTAVKIALYAMGAWAGGVAAGAFSGGGAAAPVVAGAPEAGGSLSALGSAAGGGTAAGAGTGAAEAGSLAGLSAGGAGAAGAGTAAGTGGLLAATPLATGIAPIAATAPSAAIPAASLAAGAGTAGGGAVASGIGGSGIGYGDLINAGLSYLQSRQSAGAARDASQAQIDAANRAIDEQRRQYDLSRGDFLENQNFTRNQISGLAPYQALGVGSLSNLSRLTGQPVPQGVANYQPPAGGPARDYTFTTGGGIPGGRVQASGGASAPMVMIQAPTGETRSVPADQASFYEQRGAKRLG